MTETCAYSYQHRLWHAGVREFGGNNVVARCTCGAAVRWVVSCCWQLASVCHVTSAVMTVNSSVCTLSVDIHVSVPSVLTYMCLYPQCWHTCVCTLGVDVHVSVPSVLTYMCLYPQCWRTCVCTLSVDIHVSVPSVLTYMCLYPQCWRTCVCTLSVDVHVSVPSVLTYMCLYPQCWRTCVICVCLMWLMYQSLVSCQWCAGRCRRNCRLHTGTQHSFICSLLGWCQLQ